jgi:hypothetical protein
MKKSETIEDETKQKAAKKSCRVNIIKINRTSRYKMNEWNVQKSGDELLTPNKVKRKEWKLFFD